MADYTSDLLDRVRRLTDVLGTLRYGRSTSDKEAYALQNPVPETDTVNMPNSQRAASGELFATNWPQASQAVQPWVDAARIGWFGDTPEQQSWATYGANRARRQTSGQKTR